MKNKKLLETLESETFLYAITHFNVKTHSFINRIFAYIRKNMDLLQDTNYKKLYDECILLMKWLHRKDIPEKQQEIFEIVTDIMNKEDTFSYNKEVVEEYLKFRMDSWKTGYYDELYK